LSCARKRFFGFSTRELGAIDDKIFLAHPTTLQAALKDLVDPISTGDIQVKTS
jgi:hypothetical protein